MAFSGFSGLVKGILVWHGMGMLLNNTNGAGQDIRMLSERLLEPDSLHPVAKNLMESLRGGLFGGAFLCLKLLEEMCPSGLPEIEKLSFLMGVNVLHSSEPFAGFQFLADSGFDMFSQMSKLLEYACLTRLGNLSDSDQIKVMSWLVEEGGALVRPQAKASWRALGESFPAVFALNLSRLEKQQLDDFFRQSQALEVREVSRL